LFENIPLRRVFGPKREEVAVGWGKLHNEVLHNLYSSPNIRLIKSEKMTWIGPEACRGDMRNVYRICQKN
jgi:hypothetical protein